MAQCSRLRATSSDLLSLGENGSVQAIANVFGCALQCGMLARVACMARICDWKGRTCEDTVHIKVGIGSKTAQCGRLRATFPDLLSLGGKWFCSGNGDRFRSRMAVWHAWQGGMHFTATQAPCADAPTPILHCMCTHTVQHIALMHMLARMRGTRTCGHTHTVQC